MIAQLYLSPFRASTLAAEATAPPTFGPVAGKLIQFPVPRQMAAGAQIDAPETAGVSSGEFNVNWMH